MDGVCDHIELAVSAYWDGELPTAEVRPMFLHLAECERCCAFLEILKLAERRMLSRERPAASDVLDQRIGMIATEPAAEVEHGSEASGAHRTRMNPHKSRWAFSMDPRGVTTRVLTASSLLAAGVGFVLGVTQPWSAVAPPDPEPQIVYVSVLPSVSVIGFASEHDDEGESK